MIPPIVGLIIFGAIIAMISRVARKRGAPRWLAVWIPNGPLGLWFAYSVVFKVEGGVEIVLPLYIFTGPLFVVGLLASLIAVSMTEPRRSKPTTRRPAYRCPCCGYLTLCGRGAFEICPVCFWQDDGQDDHDADQVRGGPNAALSLTQARMNFREFGASDRRSLAQVRKPTAQEM